MMNGNLQKEDGFGLRRRLYPKISGNSFTKRNLKKKKRMVMMILKRRLMYQPWLLILKMNSSRW